MRLFVAIDLPEPVNAGLEKLIGDLRPTARIAWSPRDNIHLTTKFIGEWPEQRRGEVDSALREVAGRHLPIPIDLHGVGFFPNPHSPRVFWAAVHAPPALAELARDTDEALAGLGIAKEKRPYSPHLTLARIKEPVPLNPLRQAIAGLPSTEFGAFTADRFFLYQSTLRPSGSVYTRLAEFLLSTA